jgi:hypothetical protein
LETIYIKYIQLHSMRRTVEYILYYTKH